MMKIFEIDGVLWTPRGAIIGTLLSIIRIGDDNNFRKPHKPD
jgi:hypothetical protein